MKWAPVLRILGFAASNLNTGATSMDGQTGLFAHVRPGEPACTRLPSNFVMRSLSFSTQATSPKADSQLKQMVGMSAWWFSRRSGHAGGSNSDHSSTARAAGRRRFPRGKSGAWGRSRGSCGRGWYSPGEAGTAHRSPGEGHARPHQEWTPVEFQPAETSSRTSSARASASVLLLRAAQGGDRGSPLARRLHHRLELRMPAGGKASRTGLCRRVARL